MSIKHNIDNLEDILESMKMDENENHEQYKKNLKKELKASLPKNFKLTDEFKNIIDLMENSTRNLFITGKAGTGKSTLLNYFRTITDKEVIVTAPTGIAAINVKGVTLHSFFQIPPRVINKEDPEIKVLFKKRDIFKKMNVLVIDEVSMVRADMFDAIDYSLQINRNNKLPFGGVQLILFGDIFQLSPIIEKGSKEYFDFNYKDGPFFFNSDAFYDGNFKTLELEHIFRQKDPNFISALNCVRNGINISETLDLINKTCLENDFAAGSEKISVTLCTTNRDANEINRKNLDNLESEPFEYKGKISGEFDRKSLPTEESIVLKVGAQVMFVKNGTSEEERWVNGTIGKVKRLEKKNIIVEVNNKELSVSPVSWEALKYSFDKEANKITSEVVGVFTQFPLKIAWAITIHKSQGQTFENVNIDLGRGAFTHGQTYVALSRCTTLEGISLKRKIKFSDIIVDECLKSSFENLKRNN